MDKSVEQRREIVARYLNESASAEHSGPDMVKMGLVSKAKAREDGKLEIALSTEDRDRHKDILRSSGAGLAAFKKNPVLLFAHMHTLPAVGRVTNVKKGKRDKDGIGEITGLVEFAPTALGQELKLLYEGGFMKAFSVGFIPEKWEPIDDEDSDANDIFGGGVDVKKWELLEVSAVPVPANPAALSRCDMDMLTSGTEADVITAMRAFREVEEEPPAVPADSTPAPIQDEPVEPDPVVEEGEGEGEVDAEGNAVTEYDCECIKCGYKVKSKKHCKDLKCAKCGGTMRRAERPGPGQEGGDGDDPETTLLTDDTVIERVYGLTDAMVALRAESEATVAVLERILTIKAKLDPEASAASAAPAEGGTDEEPSGPATGAQSAPAGRTAPEAPMDPPVAPVAPAAPAAPEEPAEAAFTRDDALAMLKAGLVDISAAIKETTATTIRAEMGRAVDIP